MEVIILPNADEVGRVAASIIAETLTAAKNPVIGLATGSSPLATYRELARRVEDQRLDVSDVAGFALDEYVGIPFEHPESYVSVINREVVVPLGLDPNRVHVPDGRADDPEAACADYERAITAAGGVDVQILGIGSNGHVGFNEPGSSLASRTRVKALSESTRTDNARFFDRPEQVPTHCVTQGLGTIMDAHRLVLVAQGENKADAIAAAAEGPVSAFCPASILQFHPRATLVIDEAAASKLTLTDYYRFAYENKPEWQHRD